MNYTDIVFFLIFAVALIYIALSKSLVDDYTESFSDNVPVFVSEPESKEMVMFYSLISFTPGKVCQNEYKLFKVNRWYTQVWNEFGEYMKLNHPDVVVRTVNVDENPTLVTEYNVERMPTILYKQGSNIYQSGLKGQINVLDIINFFKSKMTNLVGNVKSNEQVVQSVTPIANRNLNQMTDAIVYVTKNNCSDCDRNMNVWNSFKAKITDIYPQFQNKIFELNVSNDPKYFKYVSSYDTKMYPLILTKRLNNVRVFNMIETYGSFSENTLNQMMDDVFFKEPEYVLGAEPEQNVYKKNVVEKEISRNMRGNVY